MKKHVIILILLGFLCIHLSSVWACDQCDNPSSYRTQTRYQNPQNLGFIHGYYPNEFSENFSESSSLTPEEAGHYILGTTHRNYRYLPTVSVSEQPQTVLTDSAQVLISAARAVHIQENIIPLTASSNRPPRFNDSIDLPQVIREHQWTLKINIQ